MLAITLVFTVLFVMMAIVVGGLVGWTLNQYMAQKQPYTYHPEMFDEDGNVLADELIAFRFEGTENMEEEEETED